ncbi:MAG: bestrophin family protein [Pirellulales bacterium]
MLVRRDVPWTWTLYYAWPSLLYFLAVATTVYILRRVIHRFDLTIPFEPVVIMSTALAIFLGFKNNQAYGRWWEARIIWGLAVNYSRAWSRQVLSLIEAPAEEREELRALQRQLIRRHLAFMHALRVHLRSTDSFPQEDSPDEPVVAHNNYADCLHYLDEKEYQALLRADNPPESLLQAQGQSLREARARGWLTEYVLVQLDQTLVELNHVQGRSERIKLTPLARPYSYFQRLLVHVHGTMLPLAFVTSTGWLMIPLSVTVSFVFLSLDLIGSRIEDPFENRADDTPLSSLTRTIERNLLETLGEKPLPPRMQPEHGVLL